MKVKIISCQIFEIYINELLTNHSPNYDFDIEYFEIDQHNAPKKFNTVLQARINEITGYDLIVLIYGICGNSTSYIKAKNIPIVIPRVHDCATILLGSKKRYKEVFGHRPSQGWSCISYDNSSSHDGMFSTNNTYLELLEKYGEDNALYLFETLYPKSKDTIYISLDLEGDVERISNSDNNEIVRGSYQYLLNIFNHDFTDLQLIKPGEEITPLYDYDEVITSK